MDKQTATDKEGTTYWNPYVGGVALGIVLFLAFFITTDGLGASGGIGRLVAFVEGIFAQDHVNHTLYLAKTAGGSKNALDAWIVFMVIGVISGGLISGLIRHRVKLETFRGPQITDKMRWFFAAGGGVLMGYGARMARGCTSGQGLSGGAVLAVGSWAFLFAVFGGGFLMALLGRRLWR